MSTVHSGMSRNALWVLGAVVVLLLGWGLTGYNGMVRAREAVRREWAQVETQYQRRVDLVPNLVATVQGASQFEQATLQAVTEARTRWLNARRAARDEQIAAAGAFDSALARLLVTVESYPQLRSVEAFRDLQAQLEGTENRVAVARRDYNEAVRAYNVRIQTFPRSLVARVFGFASESFFEAAEGSDKAPRVSFPTVSPEPAAP